MKIEKSENLKTTFQKFRRSVNRSSFLMALIKENPHTLFFEYLIAENYYAPDFDVSTDVFRKKQQEIDVLYQERLHFPRVFRKYLSTATKARVFYDVVFSKRKEIELAVSQRLSNIGLNEFLFRMMAFLSNMTDEEWENQKNEISNEKEEIANSAGFNRVAAVSSLIRFAYEINQGKKRKINSSKSTDPSDKELINLSLLYEKIKEKINDIFFYQQKIIHSPFGETVIPSRLEKQVFSGFRFSQFEEGPVQGNAANKTAFVSAITGVPEQELTAFHFYKQLTYSDLGSIEKFLKSYAFSYKLPFKIIKTDKMQMSQQLRLFLKSGEKVSSAIELLFPQNTNQIFDLYQTPFIPIAGDYISSRKLLMFNNFFVNMTSRAEKLSPIGEKGKLFENEIEGILRAKGFKTTTRFSFGENENGDIDVLALQDKTSFFFECKSEMTSMDYYDSRRERTAILVANTQLRKARRFFKTKEGKNELRRFAGNKSVKVVFAILFSNARQSCVTNNEFLIISKTELIAALNNGTLETPYGLLKIRNLGKFDFLLFLHRQPLAKIFLKTEKIGPYKVKYGKRTFQFTEGRTCNVLTEIEAIGDLYQTNHPCGDWLSTFIHFHPIIFGIICYLLLITVIGVFRGIISLLMN